MIRKMGPLLADHLCVTEPKICPACHQAFIAGDTVTLIALGPGDSVEGRRKRDNGRPYNSVAAVVHWECSPKGETFPEGRV